jgi:hypothetical protein
MNEEFVNFTSESLRKLVERLDVVERQVASLTLDLADHKKDQDGKNLLATENQEKQDGKNLLTNQYQIAQDNRITTTEKYQNKQVEASKAAAADMRAVTKDFEERCV